MMHAKTALFPWQTAAVEKLRHLKVGALYMDMSTGKTRTGLELFRIRLDAGKVDCLLWLCPFSAVAEMPALFSQHMDGWEPYIKVCGIETLSSSHNKNAELLSLVGSKRVFLIVDESTKVKNPYALRSINIARIANHCAYKLILSGTPITRNESDLFAQWNILDWRILGYRSYWSFAANHLEYDPKNPKKVRRVLNLDYLAEKIAPYTYEVKRSDCFHLPDKEYDEFGFYMDDAQEANYAEAADTLLMEIDEMDPATIYRLFGALQLITSGFRVSFDHNSDHRLTPYVKSLAYQDQKDNPRMQALLRALASLDDSKVVINCKYTDEVTLIAELLNQMEPGSAVMFYGGLSAKKRAENLDAFRGNAKYLVANKSCTQYSLNLQFCHNMVFYNNDWDYATRLQAEDRLHRLGQDHHVKYIDIICRSSLDETIQKCLYKKQHILHGFLSEVTEKCSVVDALRMMIRGKEGSDQSGKDLS